MPKSLQESEIMRPSVFFLAALVAVSAGDAAAGSTPADSNKTHVKTQAQTHAKTDHAVPATPTDKKGAQSGTSGHAHATAPTGVEPTVAASGNGCAGGRREPYHAKRSASAKAEFMRNSGYPNGRHGYSVGYFIPLECGGTDTPDNMQWRPVEIRATGKTASSHP
jgi:hypothetical protein